MTRFRVLAADPAWQFDDKLPGASRGAARNYRVGSEEDLSRVLPTALVDLDAKLADDAFLFMWRVAAMVPLAYRLVERWGFVAKSELVWLKTRASGARHFGMGRTVRAAHETCIIATRGRPQRASASVRSVFEAPVPTFSTGRIIHSAKPDRFFEIVEELAGRGPRLELFARRARPGWVAWGDQAPRAAS